MSLVEKLLKEYKETTKKKIANITEQIKQLESEKLALCSVVNQTTLELQTICKHEDTVEIPGTYMSGGYDHVSEQPYTIQCKNCGKVVASKLIRGTYA